MGQPYTPAEIEFTRKRQANYEPAVRESLKEYGYDLRGLQCEILDGREVCFSTHHGIRDICPDFVTSEYLSWTHPEKLCKRDDPELEGTWCIVACQPGTPEKISWRFYKPGECPLRKCGTKPHPVPYEEFFLREWTAKPNPPKECATYDEATIAKKIAEFPRLSVGVLGRGNEGPALVHSIPTWTKGFFQLFADVTIFVNDQVPSTVEAVKEAMPKDLDYRIMTTDTNRGITDPSNWMMGNATSDFFLFLEKDFRLAEPIGCVLDQLTAGHKLLTEQKARIVRYRSRYQAGFPDWGEMQGHGFERNRGEIQRDMYCNYYHWVEHPIQMYPDVFHLCNTDPLFYCVDTIHCDWTNNPFMMQISWWFDTFVNKFDEIKINNGEHFNIENFLFTSDAWRHGGFEVVLGDGLFRHSDFNKFGLP